MIDYILRAIQGSLVAGLALLLLFFVKKTDMEHYLPTRCSLASKLCFFASGFLLPLSTPDKSLLLFLAAAYLAAMAYTDYCTKQVYPLYCLLVALCGYAWLGYAVWQMYISWVDIIWTILYILLTLIGQRLRAYTLGDAEIFIATAPALAAVAEGTGRSLYWIYTLFWIGSAVFAIVGWLLRFMMTGLRDSKVAYVPAMYGAFLALLFCTQF